MKNQIKKLSVALLTTGFVFVIALSSAQNAFGQRYLTEIKATTEVKGISQFAADLAAFLKQAEFIEQDNLARPLEVKKLEAAGKKVKDGTSNFRRHVEALIAKVKKDNRWDDAFDTEIIGSLGSRKIKAFFQRNGGRKILSDSLGTINALGTDVDTIIANAKKRQSVNFSGGGLFVKTSFASSSSAGKIRLKCVVLGVAIFGAELLKADKTAENLDGFFDQSCGAGATTAT